MSNVLWNFFLLILYVSFTSMVCYIVGIEIPFFSSFVIDSKKRKIEEWRGLSYLVGFFPTVVDFCSTIPTWRGLLLKCQMLMYCRS